MRFYRLTASAQNANRAIDAPRRIARNIYCPKSALTFNRLPSVARYSELFLSIMLTKRYTGRLAAMAAVLIPLSLMAEDKVDLFTMHRIRAEERDHSKVMDTLFYLTDVNGPRLTNSPNYFAAADWVVNRLKEYGIAAKEEKWGPFGRSWQLKSSTRR